MKKYKVIASQLHLTEAHLNGRSIKFTDSICITDLSPEELEYFRTHGYFVEEITKRDYNNV